MTVLTLVAGALLLVWPALLNGYPIVFSDTGGLLSMALEPTIGWDKPWVYGPFLFATSQRATLWLPCLAQGLLLSHVLWMLQRATIGARHAQHLALCGLLAATTAAPWFAALLMPDIFTPLTVLCLFLLAYGAPLTRLERGWVTGLAAFSIAVHLSHLIVAAAVLVPILVLRWRRLPICAAPLGIALAVLVLTNVVGNGVVGVSPFGSIFMLARLQADGVASDYLHDVCPAAGYRLCAWADRLPMDSDKFLWDPEGPVWQGEYGPTLLAAEASKVVSASLRARPGAFAKAALANTLRQVVMVRVGDALVPDYLDVTVLPRLVAYYPATEAARFVHGLQARGELVAEAAPFLWPHRVALLLGAVGSLWVLARFRRDPVFAGMAALLLVGIAANAFATGALSGPHDRYQARIAWLVVLPPLLALAGWISRDAPRHRPGSSGPAPRSRSAASG